MERYIPTEELIEMLSKRNLSQEDISTLCNSLRPWTPWDENNLPSGRVVEVRLSGKVLGSEIHMAQVGGNGIVVVAGRFDFDLLPRKILEWREVI